MNEERVYVIGTPGSSTVKIGRTIDVAKRLAEIQRMSPVPLQVLWSTPGGHALETALHCHFRALRSHGEWFQFRRDPVTLIRWAVEDEPWRRPKVEMEKSPAAPPAPSADHEGAARALASVERLFSLIGQIEDPVRCFAAVQKVASIRKLLFPELERRIACELRGRGLTWREVGEIMGGVSAQRAHQIARQPSGEEELQHAIAALAA